LHDRSRLLSLFRAQVDEPPELGALTCGWSVEHARDRSRRRPDASPISSVGCSRDRTSMRRRIARPTSAPRPG
jgi:hypothetical protein